MSLLQSSQTGELRNVWSPLSAAVKPPQLDIQPFEGDVLKWKEFWDMFEASVHRVERYANVDKFTCLKSKLSGDALQAIAGYQLSNKNYPVVVDVLKKRFGDKQLVIDAYYHNLSHLPPATNQVSSLRQCYDAIERNLRSLEAIGEDTNHRHFIALINEKLPQKVLYQLYMLRADGEEWTVIKLRQLLGRHIVAMEMASTEFSQTNSQWEYNPKPNQNGNPRRLPPISKSTASGLMAGNSRHKSVPKLTQPRCIFCDQSHWSDECSNHPTLQERQEKLKGLCYICLKKGHMSKNCSRNKTCAHCGNRNQHHRSLCPMLFAKSKSSSGLSCIADEAETQLSDTESTKINVLMQTATIVVKNMQSESSSTVRLILDSGSQRTYITDRLAKEMKLEVGPPESISVVTFGMNKSTSIQCRMSKLQLCLKDGTVMSMDVTVVPNITGNITRVPLSSEDAKFLKDESLMCNLADTIPTTTEVFPINMLIGNDYYFDLLQPRKMDLGNGLFLFQSKLGWIFGGRVTTNTEAVSESNLFVGTTAGLPAGMRLATNTLTFSDSSHVAKPDIEKFWSLESLGIIDSPSHCDDDLALDNFNNSVKFINGRYMVAWPWKEENPDLPENYQLAYGRLRSIVQKLKKDPKLLKQYEEIIQEQLRRGIIEKVTDHCEEGTLKHYITHHPIITPSKNTTKVRVVYDASAKTKQSQRSLNECLYRGPVMLPDLSGLLLRFRLSPIGVVSDIEKAFLNVGLQPQDRDVTRFLWLKNINVNDLNNNLQVYRFCRVPFGVVSSPFLLAATITYHLKHIGNPTAERIQRDIYVDNIITGTRTLNEVQHLYTDSKQIFARASMNLREWASNSQELMKFVPEQDRASGSNIKVLGINWNLNSDTLLLPGPSGDRTKEASTKREVLQAVASIFDPLGFFAPTVLEAKLFIQELWTCKFDWDTELPSEYLSRWQHLWDILTTISMYNIPRHVGMKITESEPIEYRLLCFCDASAKAYAAVIYLHQSSAGECKVDCIFSKTRLAPQKTTIPRLELLGVLIGTRALEFVDRELHLPISSKVVWTDSQCVLHWLQSNKPLPVFVENRLKEIKSHKRMSFKYVPTQENPADLATRGKSPSELQCSIWWNGPTWLSNPQEKWPVYKFSETSSQTVGDQEEHKVLFETKLIAGESPDGNVNLSIIEIERFSSLQKLLRTTAWILRYVVKFKKRQTVTGLLTSQELKKAKLLWDQFTQQKCYSDTIKLMRDGKSSNMTDQLNLMIDEQGLLRCQGRYQNTELTQGAKCPKLLPSKEPYTRLVIEYIHCKVLHSGVAQTLAEVRQEYWIPHGRSEVKRILKNCRICQRTECGPFKMPQMPPWPKERVTKSIPFEYTGLDYFGPLYIKHYSAEGEAPATMKVWVCLFTCFTVRAVHLELINDMSTEEFLLCFRRFIARRGIPRQILSDNAKQFKTASTVLNKVWSNVLTSDQVNVFSTDQGIEWKFIVDLAPWMGGLYERLVGLSKRALRKTIGNGCLTESQLVTVLTEIEAMINSRPLVYLDDDVNSYSVITPASFLSLTNRHMIPDYSPDVDPEFEVTQNISTSQKLLDKWKTGQNYLNQFWKIWSKDYLLNLRERSQLFKSKKNSSKLVPKVRDVVLIKDNLPRGQWKIGRINKLIQGRDNVVRSAMVTLPSRRTIHRALKLLYPIECPEQDKINKQFENDEDNYDKERTVRKAAKTAIERIKLYYNDESDGDGELVGVGSVADTRNNLPTGITDVNDQAQQHEQSCPARVSNDSAEQDIA